MQDIKSLIIEGKEVLLEAELFDAENDNNNLMVLLCHPHPQYGGSMHNNVVSSVFNELIKNKISCLRFNFRGVGRSTGQHSGGEGELEDVHSCIDYLVNGHFKILICGYSYGAAIGCSAVNFSEEVIGFCAISFPWDFMGEKYKSLSQTNKPKLFIQGTSDNVADYKKFPYHYKFYLEPKERITIEGADHFYWGYESQVAKAAVKFCMKAFQISG